MSVCATDSSEGTAVRAERLAKDRKFNFPNNCFKVKIKGPEAE